MIKRINKVTSIVVAAAAVASLVPATGAMAADYKRIQSEDGVIYSAVAHKDGFIIDGSIGDEDTDAVYYLSNGKYTELEDIDSGAEFKVYGDKYVSVDDADYYVDLTTGKVTDDDVAEDAQDDAEVALRKKAKDVDRYDSKTGLPTLTEIKGTKFAETWYSTDFYGYNVYTDAKGNYIDADYNLGKIKVTDTTGDSVTIKNTEDEEKLSGSVKVKASLSDVEYLGQDSSNIYRLATINFTGANIAKVYGKDGNAITTGESAKVTVIQKISKAQASDDIDDAKYAKTVTNYVLADEDGNTDSNVADFIALAIKEDANFSVVGGKIIVSIDNEDGTVTAQAATLKSKNGFYYVDAEKQSTEDAVAYDTDVNGNVYRLDGGYVYKFDNTDDWDKLYKVDGSMEELSVYDSNNMVLWNEDDEVYSIITGKSATDEEDKEEETTTTGWVQNADGTWNYLNAEGNKVTGWLQSPASGLWYYMDANGVMMSNGWVQDGGNWYLLNADGSMATGWKYTGGAWYYLKPTAGNRGAMQTGWINDNGTWYYCNASGAMLSNTTVGGYVLGANGAWIK